MGGYGDETGGRMDSLTRNGGRSMMGVFVVETGRAGGVHCPRDGQDGQRRVGVLSVMSFVIVIYKVSNMRHIGSQGLCAASGELVGHFEGRGGDVAVDEGRGPAVGVSIDGRHVFWLPIVGKGASVAEESGAGDGGVGVGGLKV